MHTVSPSPDLLMAFFSVHHVTVTPATNNTHESVRSADHRTCPDKLGSSGFQSEKRAIDIEESGEQPLWYNDDLTLDHKVYIYIYIYIYNRPI